MKTFINIILTLIIGTCLYLPMYSGTITATGNLQRETIVYDTSKGVTVKNCDNQVIRSIPDTIIATKKYQAYSYSASQAIRFEVYRKEASLNWVYTLNTTMNDISFNNSDGSFSRDLTSGSITPSRYNYVVKVFVGAEANPASEREYTLPVGGGAFPIGSVIAYLGNASTVANLEEAGWFKCDGRDVSTLTASLSAAERTTLSDVIGNKLPNLMGMFLRGLDENNPSAVPPQNVQDDDRTTRTGGENHANGTNTGVRSVQAESFKNHTHPGTTNNDGAHTHNGSTDPSGPGDGDERASNTNMDTKQVASDGGTHTHNITISSAGSNHQHSFTTNNSTTSTAGNETRPDNVAVYWLIRGR